MREMGLRVIVAGTMWAHPCGTEISAGLPNNGGWDHLVVELRGNPCWVEVTIGENDSRTEGSRCGCTRLQTALAWVCRGTMERQVRLDFSPF